MGDPRPGQIPDNIFLSIQQLKMDTDEVKTKGNWIARKASQEYYEVLAADLTIAQANAGLAQLRVDVDTTGLTAGSVSVEAMVAPSYVYAYAGAVVYPGDRVKLVWDATNSRMEIAVWIDGTDDPRLIIGRMSRVATDSAGNNASADGDVCIVKLGVN